jgi:hypothetical protein
MMIFKTNINDLKISILTVRNTILLSRYDFPEIIERKPLSNELFSMLIIVNIINKL